MGRIEIPDKHRDEDLRMDDEWVKKIAALEDAEHASRKEAGEWPYDGSIEAQLAHDYRMGMCPD